MPKSKITFNTLSIITLSILLITFGTLWALYNVSKNFRTANNDTTNQNNTTQTTTYTEPIHSQLVIIQQGNGISVDLFNIHIALRDHHFTAPNQIDTIVEFTNETDKQSLGEVHFLEFGKPISIPGYQVRLINATENSVQIVVSQITLDSAPADITIE